MIPTVQIKGLFFDRKKVRDMMDQKTHRALRHGLGMVRKIARRSMRPGGKSYKRARPGEPPRTHTRLLKDLFAYHYDQSTRSGVVGPIILPQSRKAGYKVAGALERGERVFSRVRKKFIKFKPHPFIGPALKTVSEKLPGYWLGPGT